MLLVQNLLTVYHSLLRQMAAQKTAVQNEKYTQIQKKKF